MMRFRAAKHRPAAAGFSVLELLIVCALIGVVASIGIPSFMSARASANEGSAIASARTATSGQSAYAATCGGGFYAPDALHLAWAGFASADFALPIKHGFAIQLSVGDAGMLGPADCNGDPTVTDYYFSAAPTAPSNGRRAFATNEAQGIWVDFTGVAPVEPFIEGGSIAPMR